MDANICKHSYYLTPNTLPDTEGTYRGVYVSNGTETLDDVASLMAGRSGMDPAAVKLVVRSMYGKVAELISTRVCRVNAGRVTFEAAIGGTVPYANSTLGPDNELYVAVRLNDALRNVAAKMAPRRVKADEAVAVFERVTDIGSKKTSCVIGTDPFYLVGVNLSASGEGEGVAVIDKDGVSHVAEIVTDEHGQRIKARLAEPVPAGKGSVVLTTRGFKTAEGELQTYRKNVTVLAAEPGPPVPIEFDFAQTEGMNEGQVNETADTLLHVSEGCEMPAWGEGDSITLTGRGQTWTMPTPVVDTESMTYGFQIPQDVGGTLEEDDPCEFTIHSAGRTGVCQAQWRH